MIRIAICDDDVSFGKYLQNTVENCLEEHCIQHKIFVFHDSMNLYDNIKMGEKFELMLLDIEMPNLDGLQLIRKIKELLPDALTMFISNHEKYVYDVFCLEVFRFIPKNQVELRLCTALLDAVGKLQREKEKYYIIENRYGMERLPMHRIISISRDGKNSAFLLTDGTRTQVRKTLSQVFEELPEGEFVWANRGTICNLAHVMKIKDEELELSNHTSVPVIRGKINELKIVIKNYWIRKEGLR